VMTFMQLNPFFDRIFAYLFKIATEICNLNSLLGHMTRNGQWNASLASVKVTNVKPTKKLNYCFGKMDHE